MLIYCLIVTGPAYGNQISSIALQFAQTLINAGRVISNIFFLQNGIYNSNKLISFAGDEINLVYLWRSFAEKNKIVLNVCVTAALRRGVISEQEYVKTGMSSNMHSEFKISGLSALIKAIINCDRLVQF